MTYQNDMPDYVYDDYVDRYGEEFVKTKYVSPLAITPRYRIYTKLLKTRYSINQNGEDLTNTELVALLLLHYGSITSEQFRMLSLSKDERFLYNMAYVSHKNKGQYPIEARSAGGVNKIYVLKSAGYNHINGKLPRKYIKANNISAVKMSAGRAANEHNTKMLDIVYATIADGMPPFYWYGYTDIRFARSIKGNVLLPGLTPEQKAAENYFTPDGIMEFKRGITNYVFVEQDMNTERAELLVEKNRKYGRYFEQNSEASVVTMLYNVSLNARNKYSISACHPAKDGAVSEREIVRRYIEKAEGNVYEAYKKMRENYTKWELRERADRKPRHFDSALVHLVQLQEDSGKPWDEITQEDLREYFETVEETNLEQYRARAAETGLRNRMYDVRNSILTALRDEDKVLRRAVYAGLSMVVTTTDDYIKYKHHLLPMAQGMPVDYQESLYDELAGITVPHSYEYTSCGEFVDGNDVKYVLRNHSVARNSKGLSFADFYVEEISADLAGNMRAAHFLYNCGRLDRPTYFIMLTATDDDALTLMKKTGAAERFLSPDDPRRSNRNNLIIAFVNYVSDDKRLFTIGRSGKKMYFDTVINNRGEQA